MVVPEFVSNCTMLVPFPGLNPVTEAELDVTVQKKFVFATLEVRGILVNVPEQMVVLSGEVVRSGFG